MFARPGFKFHTNLEDIRFVLVMTGDGSKSLLDLILRVSQQPGILVGDAVSGLRPCRLYSKSGFVVIARRMPLQWIQILRAVDSCRTKFVVLRQHRRGPIETFIS